MISAETSSQRGGGREDGGIASEFLTFTLGPEEYAIDILKVQEIRGYEQPTKIANTPDFIKGVVEACRGAMVPHRGSAHQVPGCTADYTPFTVVIVLNVSAG